MPKISRSALVPYSAQQMYQLVNDIASYPQFLPGCTGSRVIAASAEAMTAAVDVSKAGISKTFTTRNTLTESQCISMQLVDGPFRQLSGDWRFIQQSRRKKEVRKGERWSKPAGLTTESVTHLRTAFIKTDPN